MTPLAKIFAAAAVMGIAVPTLAQAQYIYRDDGYSPPARYYPVDPWAGPYAYAPDGYAYAPDGRRYVYDPVLGYRVYGPYNRPPCQQSYSPNRPDRSAGGSDVSDTGCY